MERERASILVKVSRGWTGGMFHNTLYVITIIIRQYLEKWHHESRKHDIIIKY
jgi:hypothetical protein